MLNDVTIFMSLSGRWRLWPHRLEWLRHQRYSRRNINLIVADCSGFDSNWTTCFGGTDLGGWNGINLYRQDVGRVGLADDPQRTTQEVYAAVQAIYERMFQEVRTKYVLVLEDDVFADDLNLIQKLMDHFQKDVVSVSVAYPHREQPDKFCAWNGTEFLKRSELNVTQDVDGHGFGCCLMDVERAKLVWGVMVEPKKQHLDRDFFSSSKFRSIVDFAIPAEHLFA